MTAHAAEAAHTAACAAGSDADRVKGNGRLLVPYDDRVGLAQFESRAAQRDGGEGAGHRAAEDLFVVRIPDDNGRARLCVVAEVIEHGALGRGIAEALRHGGAAAGDQVAACNHTAAAAFAAVVDGVVAAGGGEADADDAARDDDVAVGVQAVGVAGCVVDDRDAAAGDVYPGVRGLCLDACVGRCVAAPSEHTGSEAAGAAVGVQAVIRGIDLDLAAGDVDGQRLDALIAFAEEDAAVGDTDAVVSVNAVVCRADRECAARDGDIAAAVDTVAVGAHFKAAARNEQVCRALDACPGTVDVEGAGGDVQQRIRSLEVYTLVTGAYIQRRLLDVQAVVDVDAVLGCVDGDAAAGDGELVVDVDAVLAACRERKAAAAVDCEIVTTENYAAGIVGQGLFGILRAACHAVLGSVRESQEDLLRLLNTQACVV